MYLYTAVHYEYMGISMTKEEEINEDLPDNPNIRKHDNAYGYDWFVSKINKMPKLAYADDLRYTPDFFDDPKPEVEFLEGYSYDSLRLRENIGIISQNMAAAYGLENGDMIRITGWYTEGEAALCSVITLKIVGIYDQKWRPDTIYMPWIKSYDHYYVIDFDYQIGFSVSYSYIELLPEKVRSATFTLKDTKNLTAFRDYLETTGYSQIGKAGNIRRAIVIQDKHLVETVQSLKNHIRLIDTIKPVMLILFGVIGFIVSYLLIKHRMNELGIMRSMGAKKRQVFFSYFLEQLILFFIGLIPAAVYAVIVPGKVILYGVSLVYFVLCYLLGTALALIVINRAKILEVLFTKE
jgi:ABC-type antimicrobial peptide transport system permease subunit